MRKIYSSLMITTCLALFAHPGHAQSRSDLVATDALLTQRIDALEQRYLTGDPAAERLLQRMDGLEASQRSLTGELERVRYERDELVQQVQKLEAQLADLQSQTAELTQRIDSGVSLAQRGNSSAYSSAGTTSYGSDLVYTDPQSSNSVIYSDPVYTPEPPSGVDMTELNNLGQERLLAGDFAGAQSAFKQYIELNPDASDIGEAQFWLAETYFVRSGYADAVDAYIASMRAAPDGDKAPSAMIGLAASLRGLGDIDGACQTLDGFAAQFPAASNDIAIKAQNERQRAGCS